MSESLINNSLRDQFSDMSKRIMPQCGLSYELYQKRLSAEIDSIIDELPVSLRNPALEMAREEFDYLSQSEIENQEQGFIAEGLCSHGLDPNCCPCGCGM